MVIDLTFRPIVSSIICPQTEGIVCRTLGYYYSSEMDIQFRQVRFHNSSQIAALFRRFRVLVIVSWIRHLTRQQIGRSFGQTENIFTTD